MFSVVFASLSVPWFIMNTLDNATELKQTQKKWIIRFLTQFHDIGVFYFVQFLFTFSKGERER
jgi:hypothetical protein